MILKTEWVLCPVCGNKTRNRIREDTELKNYPLFCPKCKQETLIEAKNLKITVIKEPDAQTQSRWMSEQSPFIGSVLYIPIGRTSPPNKKNGVWWAVSSRPNKWQVHLSRPRFEFGGVFLCVGRKRLHRCLSEAAAIYIVSRRNEDNLSKKSLRMRGTLIPQK